MSTAQQVIRDFMASLDKTLLQSTAALDEAIQYCTRGRFTSMSQVIDSFVRDCSAYGGTSTALSNAFLQEYCGINLNNADTGSIVGKDAGGTFVRTAESIVSEFGTTVVYPATSSSTINGLTIKWPAKSTLTTVEQAIVARLNTWWTAGALNLIQEAYGLNFSELGTSVKEITVRFENNSRSNWLASVTNWSSNGKATKLQLNINMHYYNNMTDYVNGGSADSSAAYLDRTLAHEFTHAVMAANINWFNKLPLFIKEGTAELVHGIDDFRTGTIRHLSGNAAALQSALNMDVLSGSSSSSSTDAYAAGYMFFRYLAKQMSNPTASGTLEVLPANYRNNVYDMLNVAANGIKDVSAVNVNRSLWMYGNSNNNVMWGGKVGSWIDGRSGNDILFAGTGGDTLFGGIGNDTLDGGAGVDWFAYQSGHGKDVVYNFETNKDIVELGYYYNFYNFDGMLDIGVSGSDLVIGLQNGSMTLKDAASKQVKIHDAENHTYAHTYQKDKIILDSNYYSSTKAFKLAKHTSSIHNIDSSNTIQNIEVYGDGSANIIWAGKGMDTLVGGKGNDTIYAGSCVNVFKYNAGDGNDVIWNYKVGVDLINLPGNFTGDVVGNDVVLQVNGSGTITLKNMADKEIRIAQGSGAASTYIYSLTKPFTGKAQIRLANATGAGIYTVTNGSSDGAVAAFKSGSAVNSSVETKVGSVTAGAGAYYSYAANSNAAAQTIYAAVNKAWSIRADKGNDTVYAYGNATVNGGAGNDYISTSGSGNRLYGEEGNDTIWGGSGNDTLDGGIGNDSLRGGSGNDSLNGSDGNDTLYGDSGNDTMWGGYGNDYMFGGYGNDTLRGGYGNDYLSGGDGNDYLEVASGSNSLYGDGGNDTILGGLGSDSLYGGSGNDNLNGWANANLLVGGNGNDTLAGGAGIDTFRYSSGDGNDTISNYEDNKDIIELKSVDYLGVSQSGSDLLFKTSTGNITLKNKGTGSHTLRYRDRNNILHIISNTPPKPFTGKAKIYLYNTTGTGIYTVTNGSSDGATAAFKSGSAVNTSAETKIGSVTAGTGAYYSYTADSKAAAQTIYSASNKAWSIRAGKGNDTVYAYGNATVNGGAGNDYISASGNNNRLYGEEGNDTIWGGSGKETLDGGIGNDYLYGGNGNDSLNGSDGNDTLLGDGGNDTLYGGLGSDSLYGGSGNDSLNGWANANLLVGGNGNDTLAGGAGIDTFRYFSGDGNDTISNYEDNKDIIELKSVDYLGVSRSGNDVLFKTSTGNITLKNKGTASHTLRYRDRNNLLRTVIYSPSKPFTGKANIYLANAKGTGIYTVANGAADGAVAAFKSGSAVNTSAETKVGSVTAGTRAYYSYAADSKAAAQTIISPSNKAWFICGSKGNDSVYAYGKATVNGGAGNDYIFTTGSGNRLYGEEGNDTIFGGSGNDTLDGGIGNDLLRGGNGNDSLYGGNGNDTLYGDNGNDYISASAGNNKLYGGNGNDTLSAGGYGSNYLDGGFGNDHLSVNAGNNRLLGGAGNDTLGGGYGNDTLDGGAGNDMIFGYRGNNEIKGGQGKDSLYGGVNGAGVDRFCFGKGDGMDCIGQSDKKDIAYLYNVMGINQVNFSLKAGNLVMKLNNSDTLTVNNWMSSSTNQINTIQLGNGMKYTLGKSGNQVTVKRV